MYSERKNKMKKKKVTLVIPMYYEEKVAEECYKRVKENLVKLENYEHEIIFVIDGSTDNTLEILEGIAKKDKNVKAIFNAQTLDNLIVLIMDLFIPLEIVLLVLRQIFKILSQ